MDSLLDPAGLDDSEVDAALAELRTLVPDPQVSDLIFWPQKHSASRGLTSEELTAERIVELALHYEPFTL